MVYAWWPQNVSLSDMDKCPLWVISRHCITSASCPLFPSKRTFISDGVHVR